MNELRNIEEAIEREAARRYEALKAQCNTYGELQRKICVEDDASKISWDKDRSQKERAAASSVFNLMKSKYESEVKMLPIKRSKA